MTQHLRSLGWLATFASIIFALGGLLFQAKRLNEVHEAIGVATQAVAEADKERDAVDRAARDPRFAASAGSSSEEMLFVDGVRLQAQAQGLEIKSLGGSLISKIELPAMTADQEETLAKVREVATTVTVSGPYMNIRGFLRGLVTGDRLCNIKAVKLERLPGTLEASVTLARYIKTTGGDAK